MRLQNQWTGRVSSGRKPYTVQLYEEIFESFAAHELSNKQLLELALKHCTSLIKDKYNAIVYDKILYATILFLKLQLKIGPCRAFVCIKNNNFFSVSESRIEILQLLQRTVE